MSSHAGHGNFPVERGVRGGLDQIESVSRTSLNPTLTKHEKRRIWHLRAILSEDNWKVIEEPPARKTKNIWSHEIFICNIIIYL